MRHRAHAGAAAPVVAFIAVFALVMVALVGPVATAARAETTVGASEGASAGDAFYAPPIPLPKGRPGDVIRSVPIAAPAGARAWKVLYHSRALDGRDIAVSGLVVAPDGLVPKGGRPIVSWAHGTTGLADQCAPSKLGNAGTTLPWERLLLDRGYVLTATDYEGLGTPGPHPYLVGESEGRNVLDAARAARRLGGTRNRAGAGRAVVVVGHSQGGQAALFAGEVAPGYAPDLHVRGVVALAPAPDPARLLAAAAVPALHGFAAMVTEGLRAAFPEAEVDAVVTPEAAAAMKPFDESGCVAEIFAALRDITVLRADPDPVPSVARALARSAAGRVASGIPLLVLQGDLDLVVPEIFTRAYVARACALGDILVYQRFSEASHGSIIEAGATTLLQWLDDRIQREAPPRTC